MLVLTRSMHDCLARERWSRPGHSGRPEPFTVIFQGENMGNTWLGGLPTQSDAEFLERQKIFLIISAMRETAKECGGLHQREFHQMSVAVGYNGAQRQASWEDARMVALSTLQSGESILFHCRAGVHRGGGSIELTSMQPLDLLVKFELSNLTR